jgi:hypothetical protein
VPGFYKAMRSEQTRGELILRRCVSLIIKSCLYLGQGKEYIPYFGAVTLKTLTFILRRNFFLVFSGPGMMRKRSLIKGLILP